MSETIRGLATRVEIAREYLPDVPVDLLTRAAPAVANTLAPHGLIVGTIGYFIAARGDINGQAAIVANPATVTSWTCERLNTSRYRQFPLGLVFRPAHTWETLYEMSSFSYSEADRAQLDGSEIDMKRDRLRVGRPGAITATFGVVPQTRLGRGMDLLHDIADAGGAALVRVLLRDGAAIVFRGEPTRGPGVDVAFGQLARSDLSMLVQGNVIRQLDVPTPTYVELSLGGAVIELEF